MMAHAVGHGLNKGENFIMISFNINTTCPEWPTDRHRSDVSSDQSRKRNSPLRLHASAQCRDYDEDLILKTR